MLSVNGAKSGGATITHELLTEISREPILTFAVTGPSEVSSNQ